MEKEVIPKILALKYILTYFDGKPHAKEEYKSVYSVFCAAVLFTVFANKKESDGHLYTSGEQRTGCSMCGFGIQLEKRPHRFDRLRERNYKEWDFWMILCCLRMELKPLTPMR